MYCHERTNEGEINVLEQKTSIYETIELCLLAGKVMLQSGAETYRVEDTMVRIATAFGLSESHSYVTPTVIMFSTGQADPHRRTHDRPE